MEPFKKSIRILILLWGMALLPQAQAQILNIEKARLANDSTKRLIGNFATSFSLQQRDGLVASGQTSLNMNYASKKHAYICIGSWQFVSAEENQIVSDGYLHLRAKFLRKKVVSYEVFAQTQYDLVRGMNYRHLTGANLRLTIYKSEKNQIRTGLGLMREWESWTMEQHTVTTELWKINYYASMRLQLTPELSVNMAGYYQAKPRGLDMPRISGDAHINFKITEKLSVTSKYGFLYDFAPVVPINKLVYQWQNGVAYSF